MIERMLEAERALSVGLLDQAERLYQQAWEVDPHNSIAVVGLARVALERGDEPGAQALARRALEIDPDNQAAQRMVDRLVEVRATRSEKAPPPESPPAEAPRKRRPKVAPPEAIRTSGSGKRRAPAAPTPGPTLPKAKPLSPSPKSETQRAKPAKRPPPPPPADRKAGKEPGLLDRLFRPRR